MGEQGQLERHVPVSVFWGGEKNVCIWEAQWSRHAMCTAVIALRPAIVGSFLLRSICTLDRSCTLVRRMAGPSPEGMSRPRMLQCDGLAITPAAFDEGGRRHFSSVRLSHL